MAFILPSKVEPEAPLEIAVAFLFSIASITALAEWSLELAQAPNPAAIPPTPPATPDNRCFPWLTSFPPKLSGILWLTWSAITLAFLAALKEPAAPNPIEAAPRTSPKPPNSFPPASAFNPMDSLINLGACFAKINNPRIIKIAVIVPIIPDTLRNTGRPLIQISWIIKITK